MVLAGDDEARTAEGQGSRFGNGTKSPGESRLNRDWGAQDWSYFCEALPNEELMDILI